jgi:hypothetical protein
MNNIVDITTLGQEEAPSRPDFGRRFHKVSLSESQISVILFTKGADEAQIHYCKEPDIKSYVHCNGDDCVLCQTGVKKVKMNLMPVYSPQAGEIEVLTFTDIKRPGALLPQLQNVLGCPLPQVLLIRRPDNYSFELIAKPVPKGVDTGMDVAEAFMAEWKSNRIDLKTIYAVYSNQVLSSLSGIRRELEVRGLKVPVIEGLTPFSPDNERVNEAEAPVESTMDFVDFVL